MCPRLGVCLQTFSIPEHSIHVPFLVVGQVVEPRVFFDKPAVNFGKCLVGGARGHAVVQLCNSENMPFQVGLWAE
jgi:hypothetical protein